MFSISKLLVRYHEQEVVLCRCRQTTEYASSSMIKIGLKTGSLYRP